MATKASKIRISENLFAHKILTALEYGTPTKTSSLQHRTPPVRSFSLEKPYRLESSLALATYLATPCACNLWVEGVAIEVELRLKGVLASLRDRPRLPTEDLKFLIVRLSTTKSQKLFFCRRIIFIGLTQRSYSNLATLHHDSSQKL